MNSIINIVNSDIEGYIFDLDGVVTNTALTHAQAWKKMFDVFLKSDAKDESFVPFDLENDYKNYVDGKSRNAGIQSFLQSRNIQLPIGDPDDMDFKSVIGLGSIKNEMFRETVNNEGIECFDDALKLIHWLKKEGYPVGLATSSKNADFILQAAGLSQTFDAIMDGNLVEAYGLRPKPAADIFIFCSAKLKKIPSRCVIFEDAIAGVQAASATKPALVIGVNREDEQHRQILLSSGANVVLDDLSTLI